LQERSYDTGAHDWGRSYQFDAVAADKGTIGT
jgi:hypothetical protein